MSRKTVFGLPEVREESLEGQPGVADPAAMFVSLQQKQCPSHLDRLSQGLGFGVS